mgnify:CR=1 FL=1
MTSCIVCNLLVLLIIAQAASIGEQGFKYAGMTPDMLLQVRKYLVFSEVMFVFLHILSGKRIC